MAELRLVSGKSEFLNRKLPSGKIEQICLCEYNTDFSLACICQVHGSLLREVIENNGEYASDENIQKYRKQGMLDKRCRYCYARGTGRGNWGKVTRKEIGNITRKEFEEKRPQIIRLGKTTECGHPFYREILMNFLKLCKESNTRIIFPIKTLEFDENLALMLRETGSVLNYSICNDSLEEGAVSQGYTNAWRIEQGRLYHEQDVNITLTLTCDVTQSIEENEKRGFTIKNAINSRTEGITVRLLPLRINSKKLCYEVTGKSWHEVVLPSAKQCSGTLDLFIREQEWRFARRKNNEVYPLFFHRDFQKLVEEGIGVCGRVGNYEYCDKCNLSGNIRIKFPVAEIIPVEYTNKKPRTRIVRERNKRIQRHVKQNQ
jgi:hypothetical protein